MVSLLPLQPFWSADWGQKQTADWGQKQTADWGQKQTPEQTERQTGGQTGVQTSSVSFCAPLLIQPMQSAHAALESASQSVLHSDSHCGSKSQTAPSKQAHPYECLVAAFTGTAMLQSAQLGRPFRKSIKLCGGILSGYCGPSG